MDPATAMIATAGISGAASYFGGQSANRQNVNAQKEANKMNYRIFNDNLLFQERMSNSSYQRAMEDMRKAGLNPILAYQQGGASTPSGSSANMGAARVEDSLSKGVSSAVDAARLKKELSAVDSQNKLNTAAIQTQKATEKLNLASAAANRALEKKTTAELPGIQEKSQYEALKAREDKKWIREDAIMKRTGAATGIINNAVSAFMPKLKLETGKSTTVDSKTGEILNEGKKRTIRRYKP